MEDLHCSGESHLFCKQNHQWDATQYNVLRVVLQPVVFSDQELAPRCSIAGTRSAIEIDLVVIYGRL